MGNVRGSAGPSKGKDGCAPFEIMIGGERLAAKPEGIGWVLKWRGNERAVEVGELVILEDPEGKWWRAIVPMHERPARVTPKPVPDAFRNSGEASVVEWRVPLFSTANSLASMSDPMTVGRCGPGLRKLREGAERREEDRKFIRDREEHRKRLNKATEAAIHLRDRLADLCEEEDRRPWITPDGAEWSEYLYFIDNVPNSRRRRGSLWPVASLRKVTTLLIAKLREWQEHGKQKRGHPADAPVAAVETPLRAMGLSDSEIAQQRQFCGLEVALIDRPDRRLKGAGYAREKSRDHRRPRRGGARKRSK